MKAELEIAAETLLDCGVHYESAKRQFEYFYIIGTLSRSKGNQCKAAREMGMHRNTLRRKLADLSIDAKAGAR